MPQTYRSVDPTLPADPVEAIKPGLQSFMHETTDLPAAIAHQTAELAAARAEAAQWRGERDRLFRQCQEIANLLNSTNPEKVLHDLRNVLNELQLYKMLAATEE